jgi:hypothetical protein
LNLVATSVVLVMVRCATPYTLLSIPDLNRRVTLGLPSDGTVSQHNPKPKQAGWWCESSPKNKAKMIELELQFAKKSVLNSSFRLSSGGFSADKLGLAA